MIFCKKKIRHTFTVLSVEQKNSHVFLYEINYNIHILKATFLEKLFTPQRLCQKLEIATCQQIIIQINVVTDYNPVDYVYSRNGKNVICVIAT